MAQFNTILALCLSPSNLSLRCTTRQYYINSKWNYFTRTGELDFK